MNRIVVASKLWLFVTSGGAEVACVELFKRISNRQAAEERQERRAMLRGLAQTYFEHSRSIILILVFWRSSASLASFGDFTLERRPGWIVLHRGMQKLLEYEEAYKAGYTAAQKSRAG
jgi:hypothetical protein